VPGTKRKAYGEVLPGESIAQQPLKDPPATPPHFAHMQSFVVVLVIPLRVVLFIMCWPNSSIWQGLIIRCSCL